MNSVLETRDFSYTYLQDTPLAVPALHNVSLTVGEGERVAVVGGTRSGKSTLLHGLAALLRLRPGQVFYRGQDVTRVGRDGLRGHVGLAFQDASAQLIEDVVGKDVAFGPTVAGKPAAETRAAVERSLEAVGLPYSEFRLRYIHALSGGQRRRVALAGVLAIDPDVLLLDEPMVGLDPEGRREMAALIRRLDRTVVVAENGVGDAALQCDRLIVLEEGRVVRDGPLRGVLEDPERLEAARVALPPTVAMARNLRSIFPDFPVALIREDELQGELVRRLPA